MRNKNDKRIDPVEEDYNVSFLVEDVKLSVNNLEDGEYLVEFWNTYTGEIIATRKGIINDREQLVIDVPEFDKDIACKIYSSR